MMPGKKAGRVNCSAGFFLHPLAQVTVIIVVHNPEITKHTGIDGYLAKGITTASPDYGTGVAVFYEF